MFKLIIICIILFFYTQISSAASIALIWYPNTEPDLSGYYIHYGTAHRTYDQKIDVDNVNEFSIENLDVGTYYLCITAYDNTGNESQYSHELVIELPMAIVKGFRSK